MDIALRRAVGALALAAGLLTTSAAQADIVLYEDDFETGPIKSVWSHNAKLTTHSSFTTFNGRHSLEQIAIVIPLDKALITPNKDSGSDTGGGGGNGGGDTGGGGGGSGGGGGGTGGGGNNGPKPSFWIEFDLYIFDSWDGNAPHGADFFEVTINDRVAFLETFDNHGGPQSFRAPDVAGHLGYHHMFTDAIYRDIRVPLELLEGEDRLKIEFRGIDLQGFVDESFGIDNISVMAVPAPGAAMLGLAAAGLGAGRRRR